MNKNIILLTGTLILSVLFITACTSTPQASNTAQPVASVDSQVQQDNQVQPNNALSNGQGDIGQTGPGQNRTGFNGGNLTDAQRQQMFQQRQQAAIDACSGKNVGDTCVLVSSRYNATGICNTLNQTIQCTINRTMNRQRYTSPPQ